MPRGNTQVVSNKLFYWRCRILHRFNANLKPIADRKRSVEASASLLETLELLQEMTNLNCS